MQRPRQLPSAIRARGWRIWSPDGTSAVRLNNVLPTAITATVHLNRGWDGYSEVFRRRLLDASPTVEWAIERLEAAEREGYYSALWRDGGDAPTRPGWHHRVQNGRDEWLAVTEAGLTVLCVTLVPAAYGVHPVLFVTMIDDMPLTNASEHSRFLGVNHSQLTLFDDVHKAMQAAENEIAKRLADTGVNQHVTLLPLGDPVRERLIEEHA